MDAHTLRFQDRTYLPSAQNCPLCASTTEHLTEVPAASYEVVVFQNRFPALSAPPPEAVGTAPGQLLASRPAGGRSPGATSWNAKNSGSVSIDVPS